MSFADFLDILLEKKIQVGLNVMLTTLERCAWFLVVVDYVCCIMCFFCLDGLLSPRDTIAVDFLEMYQLQTVMTLFFAQSYVNIRLSRDAACDRLATCSKIHTVTFSLHSP